MNKKRSALSKLLQESFLATALVFIALWILFLVINISFKPFNFVAKAIKDVNLTDLYYSDRVQSPVGDTNIRLVNIENLGRKDIAALIDAIYQAGPAVIGLDVFFSDNVDTTGDPHLAASINKAADKIVLAGFYDEKTHAFNEDYKTFAGSDYGHAMFLPDEDRTAVVRKFQPAFKYADTMLYSFAAAIARKYNRPLFDKLVKRGNKMEYINYKGDKNAYVALNYREILDSAGTDLSDLKGKIVMIGFLGGKTKGTEDFKDIFYTPENKHSYGRALPDMYGLVIHANIASMIIEENYIWYMADWLVFILSFILTFMHIVFFIYFYVNRHLWYHVSVKIGQLLSFSAILLIVFQIFKHTAVLISTKYILLPVILAADILYLYEALAVWVYKKTGRQSIFIHEHKHDEAPTIENAVTEKVAVQTAVVKEQPPGQTEPTAAATEPDPESNPAKT